MPAYVYRCRECEAGDLDVVHSIHESPTFICDCGTERYRVVFAPGISLRGSGWAGKSAGAGIEGKVPPARPAELGGTLDTGKKR